MSVRFFHDNQIAASLVSLIIGTEDPAYPLSNLSDGDTSSTFKPIADGSGSVKLSLSVVSPLIDYILIGANRNDSIGFKPASGTVKLDAFTAQGWASILNSQITTPESASEVFPVSAHTPIIPAGWQAIGLASSVHNVKFINGAWIAVGDGGLVYHSIDGTVWTSVAIAGAPALRGITYGNGVYVAVGLAGFVAVSSDGINWISQVSGIATALNDVLFHNVNETFISVGDAGVILVSGDGVSWLPSVSGVSDNLLSITIGISRVVIGSAVDSLYSNDGTNWNSANMAVAGIGSLNGLMFDGLRFFAACTGGVIASYDGILWTVVHQDVLKVFNAIAYDGSTYMAAGNAGDSVSSIDGDLWVAADNIGYDVYSLETGAGVFVSAGITDISWRTYLYRYNLTITGQTPGADVNIPELYAGPAITIAPPDLGIDPESLAIQATTFTSANGRAFVSRRFDAIHVNPVWNALDSQESIDVKTLKTTVLTAKNPFFIQFDDTNAGSPVLFRDVSRKVESPFITPEFRKLKLQLEESI